MVLNFLTRERDTVQRLLPGLDGALAGADFALLESRDSPGLTMLREAGGPGLMVPTEAGGRGATLLDAVQIQRAIGARSPSLAIAANMHQCTVIAMPPCPATEQLLQAVAVHGLYLASAFGEGVPNASVLTPRLRAESVPGGWRLSGSKKPCSLSRSMDYLTASVTLPARQGEGTEVGLAIVESGAPGITVRDFLGAPILLGSETNEVVLDRVPVSEDAVSYLGSGDELNAALAMAFFTFELLVSASYLGIVSGLVEEVLLRGRGQPVERVEMVIALETAVAAVEAVAVLDANQIETPGAVARALYVRYSAQCTVMQVAAQAAELLGGISYLAGGRALLLLASARALAFHPPSRSSIADGLDVFIGGGPLVMP